MKTTNHTIFKCLKSDISIDLLRLYSWYCQFVINEKPHRINNADDEYQTHQSIGLGAHGWQFHKPDLHDAVLVEQEGMTVNSPLMSKRPIYQFANGEKRRVLNQDYTVKIEGLGGYLETILDSFPEAYRCGMKVMKAGFKYKTHIDPPKGKHYRMHIALYTNNRCRHLVLDEEYHIPTDGHVWMLNSGVEHSAWNEGDTDRCHIYWQMPIETLDKYRNMSMHI